MMIFLLCLLPILASVFGPTSAYYFLDIDNNMLKKVRIISNSGLNLSGMNLQDIKKNAFDNVRDLQSLDLSNNSLTSLPEFIFSNLTKLKSISLANNQLWKLQNLFFGLENLQMLDISRNPINHLIKGCLFGLSKSARILTDGNNFKSLRTDIYSNPQNWRTEPEKKTSQPKIDNKIYGVFNVSRLKLCKSDGIIISLEILLAELDKRCVEVPINFSEWQVDLHDQNITGFRKGWYLLHDLPIVSLNLSSNRIAVIKKNMLNELSAVLRRVNFQDNEIRKIRSRVIDNRHLKELNFKNNLIEEIENNAFAKTRLRNLYLNGNRLRNLNFVSTLPDTMIKLIVLKNHITSIPNNAFSRLPNLSYLNLGDNKIVTLQNDVFQNLTSLRTLILAKNSIKTIEPAAFKGLTALKILDLQHNSIRDLQESNFAILTALKTLNLNRNKIVNVTFIDFPRNLDTLHLESNEISALEENSFAGVSKIKLSLSANRISRIARGAFNLPILKELYLDRNNLTIIDSDSYDGLSDLWLLSFSQNQISEIRKGSCKNFKSLHQLDISYNPLQKLEAGALYGLNIDEGRHVYITGNNLKEIQVGLFDDI